MQKTEMKAKRSTRKPLRDVTNAEKSPKAVMNKRNKATVEDSDDVAQLDRLLLIHSDLSSVLHQVDELVAKALKAPGKIGRTEIGSFTQVLSEILSSLKPWPLRFQKAISTQSKDTEKHLNQCLLSETLHGTEHTVDIETVHGNEHRVDVVKSPEESKFDAMISPSPLVAWRGEFNADGGRQLFLLTPLPRPKAFSSNPRGSLKSNFEKLKSDNRLQSLIAMCTDTNDGEPKPAEASDSVENMKESTVETQLLKSDFEKFKSDNGLLMAMCTDTNDGYIRPNPAEVSDFVENTKESTVEAQLVSPPKFSQLVFTPRMKMSPPKSCVLLEPVSELAQKSYCGVRKSTPFPVGLQGLSSSESSESSDSGVSEDLTLKYPELFGIQPIYKLGNEGKRVVELSPDWVMSPPKSCVLMEPSDEKLLTDAMKNFRLSRTAPKPDQLKNANSDERDVGNSDFPGLEFGDNYAVVENTPMFKEPKSTFGAKKRHPGEDTLKKELWMKFEAASTRDSNFDVSVLKTAHKGFLDRLEEVSFDETKHDNNC